MCRLCSLYTIDRLLGDCSNNSKIHCPELSPTQSRTLTPTASSTCSSVAMVLDTAGGDTDSASAAAAKVPVLATMRNTASCASVKGTRSAPTIGGSFARPKLRASRLPSAPGDFTWSVTMSNLWQPDLVGVAHFKLDCFHPNGAALSVLNDASSASDSSLSALAAG